ncbi:ADP-ribose pyrophosphatase YjhB (NUDIX family) [Curtobacterium pusillum]|uniref:ADP-ribose pyrophosphatase YjhB (NUDIX family) n=1 Tax=Curtobacterium pusillum TaxID=69373 RepID=A0AAW3T3N4_9MICO|nr:NUDIX hydrolase [Curtobacterium pusillum]MBA8989924.1 ADP-ribose pyrophosphatase YjhB (NUDIX family) [Curtobacterium pusillum]
MTSQYRDAAGKRLTDYPRPSVAVDTAVLTVPVGGALSVLQVRDAVDGYWRLPGTFVHEGERLAAAVLRSLATKAGVTGLAPEQLHVFDDPSRDDRGWVLSVAHVDVVPAASLVLDDERARVVPVASATGMVHGHDDIVEFAVASLRSLYSAAPDPRGLLAEPFTMTELRRLHEAVRGEALLPDSFRRAMVPLLAATDAKRVDGPGKPATRYRRR